jgi:hypothetical protein
LAEAAAAAAGSRGTVAMKRRLDIGFGIFVSSIITSESQGREPIGKADKMIRIQH